MLEAALRAALDELARSPDVRYAEVRGTHEISQRLRVRDGRPEQATSGTARGVAIRVLGPVTWGFACTPNLDVASVVGAARRAIAVAKASGRVALAPLKFPPQPASTGTYATRVEIDPFTIPI